MNRMIKTVVALSALVVMVATSAHAKLPRSVMTAQAMKGKIVVAATSPELAKYAREIGGGKVYVISLTKQFPPKEAPTTKNASVMNALRKADMLLKVGGSADEWVNGLVDASKNAEIGKGIECSGASSVLAVLKAASPKDADAFQKNFEASSK